MKDINDDIFKEEMTEQNAQIIKDNDELRVAINKVGETMKDIPTLIDAVKNELTAKKEVEGKVALNEATTEKLETSNKQLSEELSEAIKNSVNKLVAQQSAFEAVIGTAQKEQAEQARNNLDQIKLVSAAMEQNNANITEICGRLLERKIQPVVLHRSGNVTKRDVDEDVDVSCFYDAPGGGGGAKIDLTALLDCLAQLLECCNEQTAVLEAILSALEDLDVSINNWDEMPLGIEAALAPVGCTVDEDGEVTGKVFVCKVVDEDNGAITYELKHIATDGTVTDNWTGDWVNCADNGLDEFATECTGLDGCGEKTYCMRFVISETETSQDSPFTYGDGTEGVIPSGGAYAFFTDLGYTQDERTFTKCVPEAEVIGFVVNGGSDGSGVNNGLPADGAELPYYYTAISDIRGFIDSVEEGGECPKALLTKGCNDDRRDDLLEDLASVITPCEGCGAGTTVSELWCTNTILWALANPNTFFEFGGVTVPDNGSQQNFITDYNTAAAAAGSPHSFVLNSSGEMCYNGSGEFGEGDQICRVDERGEELGCTDFQLIETTTEGEHSETCNAFLVKLCDPIVIPEGQTLPVEECCNSEDPETRDRWCQGWNPQYPVGDGSENTTIQVNAGTGWIDLPNPYTEADILSAITAAVPGAGFIVLDGQLCRFDGPGGVSIKTESRNCSLEPPIICSLQTSVTAPLQLFVAGADPVCREYVRTWGKYEQPIGDTLASILATNTEMLNAINTLNEKMCELIGEDGDECPCVECPRLTVGSLTSVDTGNPLPIPHLAPNGFNEWTIPFSADLSACDPDADIVVRVTQDHEAGAFDNHRAYVLVTSAGTFTAVSASNSQAPASNATSQIIGYAAGDNVNGPRAIRWSEITLKASDLTAGVSLTSGAFGGVGGATEAMYSLDIEIVSGLEEACNC